MFPLCGNTPRSSTAQYRPPLRRQASNDSGCCVSVCAVPRLWLRSRGRASLVTRSSSPRADATAISSWRSAFLCPHDHCGLGWSSGTSMMACSWSCLAVHQPLLCGGNVHLIDTGILSLIIWQTSALAQSESLILGDKLRSFMCIDEMVHVL